MKKLKYKNKGYKSKCPVCNLMKYDVIWMFAGKIGCKDCGDKYFKDLLNNTCRGNS